MLGKTSTRSVWKKGEKGRKNACGSNTRERGELAKKFLKNEPNKRVIKANSKDKNAAKKLLNKDLRRDSDFKEKFERDNREAARLRAGGSPGTSRRSLKEPIGRPPT